jgi:hypothetical protein
MPGAPAQRLPSMPRPPLAIVVPFGACATPRNTISRL